jgi:hypothetical protein
MAQSIQKRKLDLPADAISSNRRLSLFVVSLGSEQLSQDDFDLVFAPGPFAPTVDNLGSRHPRWPPLGQLLEIGVPFIEHRNNDVQFPINRLRLEAILHPLVDIPLTVGF